jgi:hypothetical protein
MVQSHPGSDRRTHFSHQKLTLTMSLVWKKGPCARVSLRPSAYHRGFQHGYMPRIPTWLLVVRPSKRKARMSSGGRGLLESPGLCRGRSALRMLASRQRLSHHRSVARVVEDTTGTVRK